MENDIFKKSDHFIIDRGSISLFIYPFYRSKTAVLRKRWFELSATTFWSKSDNPSAKDVSFPFSWLHDRFLGERIELQVVSYPSVPLFKQLTSWHLIVDRFDSFYTGRW